MNLQFEFKQINKNPSSPSKINDTLRMCENRTRDPGYIENTPANNDQLNTKNGWKFYVLKKLG